MNNKQIFLLLLFASSSLLGMNKTEVTPIQIMSIKEAEARGLIKVTTASQTRAECIMGMQDRGMRIAITQFLQIVPLEKISMHDIFQASAELIGTVHAAKQALQEYRDNEGNSLTLLLVKHGNVRAVLDSALNNVITFEPNKAGLTPFDIIPSNQNQKCCLCILSNYDKSQMRGFGKYHAFEKCCNKDEHKFDVVSVFMDKK